MDSDYDHIGFHKTSSEPQIVLDDREHQENEDKYLSYVDEMHSRINSKSFREIGQVGDESSSEIYSQHRLRSSSSEKQSSVKLEETQGRLYVIK